MRSGDTTARARAALALAAIVPAPTLGILAALYLWPASALGQGVFFFFKLWLLLMPVLWLVLVEKQRPRLPALRGDGLGAGVATGLGMAASIVTAYLLFGHWIDADAMSGRLEAIGLETPTKFLLGALYWCTVNSFLEEYVWRWFVFTRCERLMSRVVAIVAAGLFFMLHHTVALAFYFDWRVTMLASAGVFIGGATWSWIYLRWRNIYAAYVSHVLADLAVFGVGWYLVFGGSTPL